jgi:hypothetical protein
MTFPEVTLLVGVLIPLALAMGPWMFKVHAKLAVIASKIVDLCDRIEQAADDHQKLWQVCSKHESRLDTHDVQLSHIAERLRRD